jgi:hypothetical protein
MSDTAVLDWNQIDLNPITKVDIHLVVFLDNSSSMRNDWPKTISGIKEYFSGLKNQPDATYIASLYSFANTTKKIFEDVNIKTVEVDESIDPIRANGISTSLYDSMGTVLSKIKDENHPFLVVVFTDGEDNSSESYKVKDIRKLFSSLEEQGNFTFVFMGASPDAWAQSATLGTHFGNTSLFDKSQINKAYRSLGASTMMYSSSMNSSSNTLKSTKNFYGTEEAENIVPPINQESE